MTREQLLDDLTYARTLAEEGRHAPLIGGAFLILFGVLLAIAWTAHWALITGHFGDLPPSTVGMIWVGYGIAAGISAPLVSANVRKKPGGTAIGNRIDRAVWQGSAIAILAVVVGTLLSSALRGDMQAPNAIMAAAFGVYGVALTTTAKLASKPWLAWFGYLAFVLSAVLWAFANEPWAYLLAAASAVIVLITPGVMMMRREPRETV